VVDEPLGGLALLQRHRQGVQGQLAAQVLGIAQPMTLREQPSRIAAKYSQPSSVGM
jgi:hypothetical protein